MATELQEFRARLLQMALNAVEQVNCRFLDLLCARARWATETSFPLGDALQARFSNLTRSERRQLARSGTLLVDAGFSDPHRWKEARTALESSDSVLAQSNHRTASEAVSIAYSTLFVAWAVVNGSRGEAGVLLGTTRETEEILAGMGVNEIAGLAERHPEWIRPRWEHLPNAWSNLLDLLVDPAPARSRLAAIRCLQLISEHSAPFETYIGRRSKRS